MSKLQFNEFAIECHNAAKAKGFHDTPPNTDQVSAAVRFLQIVLVAAKDFELARKTVPRGATTPDSSLESRAIVRTALLGTEFAELAEWALERDLSDQTANPQDSDNPKPEGFGSELADVLIRMGDMAGELGVDLEFEAKRKLAYNATRPFKHGKIF
jgi:NTP pyrophosphatase (non-canonical NTP hydrolase)